MRVIHISVDLSEATTRHLVHAKVRLPVKPDPVARFTTPLWIPESHINNGPVGSIAGLHFHFLGENNVKTELTWSRDAKSPHEYLVQIPANVDEIHAEFYAIVTRSATSLLFLFGWELVLLYPIGDVNGSDHRNVDKIPIRASVTYQMGWKVATALENLGESETELDPDEGKATCHYLPTTVRRLMDSPVLMGYYIQQYNLHSSPEYGTQEVICIAAAEQHNTNISPELLYKLSNMIVQTQRLFGGGPPPYALPSHHGSIRPASLPKSEPIQKFYFLVALSDRLPNIGGVEHLASTQIILQPRTLHDTTRIPTSMIGDLTVIAHEYLHSWNGKRTTPAGNNPPDFNTPLDGRLLWVYEGLTTYYEAVLSVRAGLITKEDWIRNLAWNVAQLGNMEGGKHWRSLEDFGLGGSITRGVIGPIGGWEAWRGDSFSFYVGGGLVWFGVDVLLRRFTGGTRSLDDFMASFFGVKEHKGDSRVGQAGNRNGKWATVEYTLDDIIKSLTWLGADDWKGHFRRKVLNVMTELDLTGIEGAGYRLEWMKGSPVDLNSRTADGETLLTLRTAIWNSLGILVDKFGNINDVRRGSPADASRLAPRLTIIGVGENLHNRRSFDIFELAKEITRCAEHKDLLLRLQMAREESDWTVEIGYHGGLQYPVIVRDERSGLSDLLDDILRPLEAPVAD